MRAPDPAEPAGEDTQSIAREARAGDLARFAELYERIAPALYAWAALRIRPAMRAYVDPQDLVQEVWTRAWKAFPGFDPDATPFRSWIFRIAKNVLLEGFRRARRLAPGDAGPTTRLFQLGQLPDSATAVSRRLARDEGLARVLAWAEALEPEEQELFLHCGLEGLPYAEVAARMQLQRDAVAKRWQVLRERIARFGVPKDLALAD
jgi:RNA polymerase sigma-70 factor (ECF subfamily)